MAPRNGYLIRSIKSRRLPAHYAYTSATSISIRTGSNGAVDFPIPLITQSLPSGQQFIDFLFLYTDQAVSYKTQGPDSTPNPIRACGVSLQDSMNITSILISNSSGVPAKVGCQQARWQPVPTS